MELLRHHFRPEFLNRVDEVVVFHALGRAEIRAIVGLQLQRVARTAAAQDVQLEFDDSLVDHLAEIGYDPEFGARMLKRKLRSEVESRLATAMLKGAVSAGQTVKLGYDPVQKALRIDKVSDGTAPGAKQGADTTKTKTQAEAQAGAEAATVTA